jgi:hypothetical protein
MRRTSSTPARQAPQINVDFFACRRRRWRFLRFNRTFPDSSDGASEAAMLPVDSSVKSTAGVTGVLLAAPVLSQQGGNVPKSLL